MNECRINPDGAIDRLLTGLRDVEPPQGMERRILDAAKERSATRRSWNSARPFATSNLWTLAVASVAIVAVATAWFMFRNHRNENQSADVRRHDVPSASSAQRTSVSDFESVKSLPAKRYLRATPRLAAPAVEMLSDEEALALSEMNAPSRPAPPLPLTHQEKLLAEAVHQAGPEELSSLRPEVRARQMELSKAEFHDFFEPPPAKDNE